MDNQSLPSTARRIINIRTDILNHYPFFGRLLMHLGIGFAECGTACTDAEKIIFDPLFASKLSDEEAALVLLHELLHVVLNHCTRGKGRQKLIYNLACDIVVNSCILDMLSKKSMSVAGEEVMHLAPTGQEGRNYTADEVYDQLLNMPKDEFSKQYTSSMVDSHESWEAISDASVTEHLWKSRTKSVFENHGASLDSPWLNRHYESVCTPSEVNWKDALYRFLTHCDSTYSYQRPDKRFYYHDYILPSYVADMNSFKANRLWFLVDTSGSISDKELSLIFSEIKHAAAQIGSMSGFISFFDTEVTPPVEFEDVTGLDALSPRGGGGTSFHAIFNSMDAFFPEELPKAVIIMTDGYAAFPDEEAAQGVPVIWIISEKNRTAPWGDCVYVTY